MCSSDLTVAIALMSIYIHRYSKQPMFLYLVLMFVAPCLTFGFGIPGIFSRIIDINPPRLLALTILLPIAIRLSTDPDNRVTRPQDIFILLFYFVISLISLRLGDINSILRVLPGLFIDILLPYFVFSRSLRNGLDINRAMMAFAVAAMPLAAIGLFEIMKGWRVYYGVVVEWDFVLVTGYLFRDGMLRAATTSVEAIAFGFMCMTGAGCLLAVRCQKSPGIWWKIALGILLVGLLASVSRGPWVGLAICVLVILLGNLRLAMKLFFASMPVIAVLFFVDPPSAERFLNLLPFIGSADKGSETYRSMLMESSLVVIGRYPLFGSETFLAEPEMQRLIQGQGIIDVVNSYLQIALSYGLFALLLFILFALGLIVGLGMFFLKSKTAAVNHIAVLGLLVGMLVTIATTSSVSVIPHIYWAFFGICSAILTLGPHVDWHSVTVPRRPVRRVGDGLVDASAGIRKVRVLRPNS